MKKWTAVHHDISKSLSKVKFQRIKIPSGLNLYLIIELDDAAYNILTKDPVWLQRMQDKASAKVEPLLDDLADLIVKAEQKAAKFDAKAAAIFSKDLNTIIKKRTEVAGAEMAREVDKFFEDYKKGQKELTKFRIKSGVKITMNAIVIVGAVAATVATYAAFAPAGIVAIARGGIVISQECAKLAMSADQMAKLIKGELIVLGKIMKKNMEAASKKAKAVQSAKEIGLGLVSAGLGIETPSLKNCKGHIEVHKVDIAKLDAESHKLAKTIYKAMDEQKKWEAKFLTAQRTLPIDKVRKVKDDVKKVEAALDKILKATVKINEAINRANERQVKFEKTLEAMMKGIPAWVQYVQTVATLTIDIGLAVGGASTALEQGLWAIVAAEVDIGSELVDRA